MPPRYPLPWRVLGDLVCAALPGRRRTFSADARACMALLQPPAQITGIENIPQTGPYLLTINHYTRPGFGAWWLALAASAALTAEVHWVVTGAWTYPDPLRERLFSPATRWAFQRMAAVYGFTSMPPMPPRAEDTLARARAVRQALAYARRTPQAVIGLAPEGQDFPGGVLGQPPPGVGRFILHLAGMGLRILPVGAFEDGERFCLRFGAAYVLEIPTGFTADERDRLVSRAVMGQIARLLPVSLQGSFAYNVNLTGGSDDYYNSPV